MLGLTLFKADLRHDSVRASAGVSLHDVRASRGQGRSALTENLPEPLQRERGGGACEDVLCGTSVKTVTRPCVKFGNTSRREVIDMRQVCLKNGQPLHHIAPTCSMV